MVGLSPKADSAATGLPISGPISSLIPWAPRTGGVGDRGRGAHRDHCDQRVRARASGRPARGSSPVGHRLIGSLEGGALLD